MNQVRIDKIGVAAAVNYFCRMGYIDPHFEFDDKVPVWDGSIDVHKSENSESKEDIQFNIPVQVKSSEHRSNNFNTQITHPIEVHDLELYKRKGGTILIKVLFNKHKAQLYFAFLSKVKLTKLLSSCQVEKTKAIQCNKAPETYKELFPSLKTMHLQSQYNLINKEELQGRDDFSVHFSAGPISIGEDPLIWLARNPTDILVKLQGLSMPFYLGDGPMRMFAKRTINEPVRIDGKIYFEKFTIGTIHTGFTLSVGDFLEYTDNSFIDEKSCSKIANLKVKPSASIIEDYVNELDFILAANTHNEVSFGSLKLDITAFQLSEESKNEITGNLRFWNCALNFFKKVGIPSRVDKSKFSDADIDTLEYLINVFECKVHTVNKNLTFPLVSFHIAQYLLCFGCEKINESDARLYDLRNCTTYRVNDITSEKRMVPIHSYCFSHNLFPQNLDYKEIVDAYAKYKIDAEYLQLANLDALALVSEFDRTNDSKFLYAAHRLQDWIVAKNTDSDWNAIFRINVLQIWVREKKIFSEEENQFLYELCESDNYALKFAAHVLLDECDRAKIIWERHPEIHEGIEPFAIYHLYKQLEINEQNENINN